MFLLDHTISRGDIKAGNKLFRKLISTPTGTNLNAKRVDKLVNLLVKDTHIVMTPNLRASLEQFLRTPQDLTGDGKKNYADAIAEWKALAPPPPPPPPPTPAQIRADALSRARANPDDSSAVQPVIDLLVEDTGVEATPERVAQLSGLLRTRPDFFASYTGAIRTWVGGNNDSLLQAALAHPDRPILIDALSHLTNSAVRNARDLDRTRDREYDKLGLRNPDHRDWRNFTDDDIRDGVVGFLRNPRDTSGNGIDFGDLTYSLIRTFTNGRGRGREMISEDP